MHGSRVRKIRSWHDRAFWIAVVADLQPTEERSVSDVAVHLHVTAVTIDSEEGTVSYTILSFCGGGIRGLASATLLQRLWPDPAQPPTADLLAGTSTGTSIISWLLAGQGPAQTCQNYLTGGVKFFTNPSTNPLTPAYDIKEVIAAQLLLHRGDPKLSTLRQGVLMTSFNVGGWSHQRSHSRGSLCCSITWPARPTRLISGSRRRSPRAARCPG